VILRNYKRPRTAASPETLKKLLSDYRIKRSTAALWMDVAAITFDRYCLPLSSKQNIPIPKLRWEELLRVIQQHAHPTEKVTI
jgi:hypothetical protein